MNLEDLATKQDLENLKSYLVDELVKTPSSSDRSNDKRGMTSKDVRKALGGVSPSYVETLRKENILSAKKIGGNWIYNYQQVMDCIPDYKKKITIVINESTF